jgi:hypothetical protein
MTREIPGSNWNILRATGSSHIVVDFALLAHDIHYIRGSLCLRGS